MGTQHSISAFSKARIAGGVTLAQGHVPGWQDLSQVVELLLPLECTSTAALITSSVCHSCALIAVCWQQLRQQFDKSLLTGAGALP